MAHESEYYSCLDVRAAQYPRGPTDVPDTAFSSEKAVVRAIEDRCGKATSPQSGMPPGKVRNPWDR